MPVGKTPHLWKNKYEESYRYAVCKTLELYKNTNPKSWNNCHKNKHYMKILACKTFHVLTLKPHLQPVEPTEQTSWGLAEVEQSNQSITLEWQQILQVRQVWKILWGRAWLLPLHPSTLSTVSIKTVLFVLQVGLFNHVSRWHLHDLGIFY